MLPKKNPLLDLEQYRLHFLLVGLAIALGIVLWLFNFKVFKPAPVPQQVEYRMNYPDAEIPITVREIPEKVSAPANAPEQINLVEDVSEVDDDFEFSSSETNEEEALTDRAYQQGAPAGKGEIVTIEFEAEEEVPMNFAVVESVPVFPGCEEVKNNEERKLCFQHQILAFASKNFKYTENARQMRLTGRVFVQFVIEKDGSIANVQIVRGIDPLVDEEAVRVVKSLPKMEPARQRGKPVRMSFVLPIKLVLE